jgi:hypothetical protein
MTINEDEDDLTAVCDFCGVHWMPRSKWYWAPVGDRITHLGYVDYCPDCADAWPKLIADLRHCNLLRE